MQLPFVVRAVFKLIELLRSVTVSCLVHVTPPTAIRGGCVCGSELEHASLEVSQLVWYGGSRVDFQEQAKEWHPAQHKITGADVQDRSSGRLVQLGGGMVHGPRDRQLELLECAEKDRPQCHLGHAPRCYFWAASHFEDATDT